MRRGTPDKSRSHIVHQVASRQKQKYLWSALRGEDVIMPTRNCVLLSRNSCIADKTSETLGMKAPESQVNAKITKEDSGNSEEVPLFTENDNVPLLSMQCVSIMDG